MCVTDEQPGGRAGRLRAAPPGCGRHRAAGCACSACGRDTGARRARREPPSREGEECSVPEVKPSGGKILRRGVDDFGGDLQFQQKSLRQCQLSSSPSPIWEQ